MSFEAEVIPMFLVCAGVVSILELIIGCLLLKNQTIARNRLIGMQSVWRLHCFSWSAAFLQTG